LERKSHYIREGLEVIGVVGALPEMPKEAVEGAVGMGKSVLRAPELLLPRDIAIGFRIDRKV